jgi:hypothetical protein
MNIEDFQNSPTGKLLRAGEGETAYWAFVPHPLPWALEADCELGWWTASLKHRY